MELTQQWEVERAGVPPSGNPNVTTTRFWSAELTVGDLGNTSINEGFSAISGVAGGILTNRFFEYKGKRYEIRQLYLDSRGQFNFYVSENTPLFDTESATCDVAPTSNWTLHVANSTMPFATADSIGTLGCNWLLTQHDVYWSDGPTYSLALSTTEPGAPRSLRAASESAAVTLSWTPPATIGGSAITAYQYRYKTDADYGDWIEIEDSANATSHRITRLAATPHTFQLAAVNSSGRGLYSDEVTQTPMADTTPPRLVAATVDGSDVLLDFDEEFHESSTWSVTGQGLSFKVGGVVREASFNLHINVGLGNSILSFTLVSPVLATDKVTVSYAPPARPPNTNFPLRDWTGNFVAAFTDVPVRNLTVAKPQPPTELEAVPAGSGRLKLSWTAGFDGNSRLTRHEFQQKTTGTFGTTWNRIPNSGAGGANATSYTVTGLTDGTLYTFRLRAVNVEGESDPSDEVSGTPSLGVPPSAPRNVLATPGDRFVRLEWFPPADAGGVLYEQLEYRVRWKALTGPDAAFGNWSRARAANPDTVSQRRTVSGLTNGVAYAFEVRALNVVGEGGISAPEHATPEKVSDGVPSAPQNLAVATDDSTRAELRWSSPWISNAVGITGYSFRPVRRCPGCGRCSGKTSAGPDPGDAGCGYT